MINVIGERFSCEQVTESFDDDPVKAYARAVEMSNEHDMDFVVILIDGIPAKYIQDGKVT